MSEPTVLVVEDNVNLRQSLIMFLEMEGISTLAAADGSEAVEILKDHAPNVVLLDMQLPGKVSGLALLRAIKRSAKFSSTRVVLHTAEPNAPNLPEAVVADFVIVKPAELDELLALIRRLF